LQSYKNGPLIITGSFKYCNEINELLWLQTKEENVPYTRERERESTACWDENPYHTWRVRMEDGWRTMLLAWCTQRAEEKSTKCGIIE
jgi:hypothetical protein